MTEALAPHMNQNRSTIPHQNYFSDMHFGMFTSELSKDGDLMGIRQADLPYQPQSLDYSGRILTIAPYQCH